MHSRVSRENRRIHSSRRIAAADAEIDRRGVGDAADAMLTLELFVETRQKRVSGILSSERLPRESKVFNRSKTFLSQFLLLFLLLHLHSLHQIPPSRASQTGLHEGGILQDPTGHSRRRRVRRRVPDQAVDLLWSDRGIRKGKIDG